MSQQLLDWTLHDLPITTITQSTTGPALGHMSILMASLLLPVSLALQLPFLFVDEDDGVHTVPDQVPPDHLVHDVGALLLFLVLPMLQCGLLPVVISCHFSANLETLCSMVDTTQSHSTA